MFYASDFQLDIKKWSRIQKRIKKTKKQMESSYKKY